MIQLSQQPSQRLDPQHAAIPQKNVPTAGTDSASMAASRTVIVTVGGNVNRRLSSATLGSTRVYPRTPRRSSVRLSDGHVCQSRTGPPGVIPYCECQPQPGFIRRTCILGYADVSVSRSLSIKHMLHSILNRRLIMTASLPNRVGEPLSERDPTGGPFESTKVS